MTEDYPIDEVLEAEIEEHRYAASLRRELQAVIKQRDELRAVLEAVEWVGRFTAYGKHMLICPWCRAIRWREGNGWTEPLHADDCPRQAVIARERGDNHAEP